MMADRDLALAPAYELKKMLVEKKISCLELTDFFLKRIEEKDPDLNTFLYIDTEGARGHAKEVDALIQKGETDKPLLGLPCVIPDSLNMKGAPTTYGSRIFKDKVQDEDAPEICHIKEFGAVILGKTNIAEFGLSNETINRLRDPCRNPIHVEYSPGGSAGGTAASVAAGLAPIALGTDFHGGVRLSSSFCGVPGMMPTRGLIPNVRRHLLPFAERMFYRKGITARNVADIAHMLQVLVEYDSRDPTCRAQSHQNYDECVSVPPETLKIAFSPKLDFLPVEKEVLDGVTRGAKQLEELGHTVEEVEIGLEPDVLSHFQNLFAADRYVLIMNLLHEHPERFDLLADETKEWLRFGNDVTGAQYSMAVTYMANLGDRLNDFFKKYDVLITPTSSVAPFKIGQVPTEVNGMPIRPFVGHWGFLVPFNMSGHPAMVLPCGTSAQGLPIGMQLIGPQFSEGMLLALASQVTG